MTDTDDGLQAAPAPANSASAPAIPTLSRARHDRAAEHRRDQGWLDRAWETARVLPLGTEGTVPVGADGVSLAWTAADTVDQSRQRYFLGIDGPATYFAVAADAQDDWVDLRELGSELGQLDAGLLTAAVAVANWHATHTHCPRCGGPTDVVDGGWARRCSHDGSQHFPRTDPAVIMLVHDGGDRCVLGRQPRWPAGRFSILAGFVEAGESAEAAVAREVYEEAGLRITDITYRSSQPWPFPASLMLGFTARAVGDLGIARHDDELADAGWFTRAEVAAAAARADDPSLPPSDGSLQALPGGVSIARFLLDEWLQG